MFQDPLIKILLLPFSLLYGLGVSLRDFFYRRHLLMSVEFNVPVISVGNLSIGGAGKTPHIEYLIRLLDPYLEVATLSRGYRRNTQGFQIVNPWNTALESGDEPLMFKKKFGEVFVAVSESRSLGIPEILQKHPSTQVILLDDAFQHRSVHPGLNILLTEYGQPFTRDFLMPSGRLREWRSAYQRADVIVVSKCPGDIGQEERAALLAEIKPFPHQRLFFSSYHYLQPYYILNPTYKLELTHDIEALLVCAIAGTAYLLEFLKEKLSAVRVQEFEDHHYFDTSDLDGIEQKFAAMTGQKKLIITTEKDAMRLMMHRQWLLEKKLPVMVLPVEVNFHFGEQEAFDAAVKDFLLNFKS
ncbi:MAG: tetraacyldisaccharide 4'-kinase [Saprospiraceae bacterium]|nr:MAG: tetraacyldisaccharide 4'-kinase [Saprospiraceae bacterium]